MGMKGLRNQSLAALLGVSLLTGPGVATAFEVTWNLFDHPDGTQNPPGYGIRLDDVVRTKKVNEVYKAFDGFGHQTAPNGYLWDDYSFSFDHADSDIKATYNSANAAHGDQETFRIHGTVRGGRFRHGNQDTGATWDMSALWAVDLFYVDNPMTGGYAEDMITRYGSSVLGTARSGVEGGVEDPLSIYIDKDLNPPDGFSPSSADPLDFADETYSSPLHTSAPYDEHLGTIRLIDDASNHEFFQDGDGFVVEAKAAGTNFLFYDLSQHRLNCADSGGVDKSGHRNEQDGDEMCNRWTGAGWLKIKWNQLGKADDPFYKHGKPRDLLFTGTQPGDGTPGIPEPGSLMLLGVGLVGFSLAHRRQRRRLVT